MTRYGIIDLGSNTIRLVAYDVKKASGVFDAKSFSNLISSKKTVGLSSYVEDGVLGQAGIDKAVSALKSLLVRADLLKCDKVGIFATAVIRNCANSKKATAEIEKRIDCPIDVISGKEEALLDFAGATCDRQVKRGTLVDIGGGSTELVAIKDGAPKVPVSLDLGSVAAYKRFVARVIPTPGECGHIGQAMAKRLEGLAETNAYKCETIYGVGGSIRAMGKMHGALGGSRKATKLLRAEDVNAMLSLMEDDPSTFAHTIAQESPDRIHTIGSALVIIHTIMEAFGASSIEICKYGVREGYLIERMVSKE